MYTDNAKESDFFGRVVNERACIRLEGILKKDKKFIVYGGDSDASTDYVEPTILDFGTDFKAFKESAAMEDEIFGPILPMYRYKNLDEAIDFVTGGDKPLSCYVFTTNSTDRENILVNTTSGSANVNDVMMHACNPNLPFGGVGKSGMGRYHGKFSFECFSHYKSVLFKMNHGDVPFRYPPYTGFKVTALGTIQSVRPGWVEDGILNVAKIAVVVGVAVFVKQYIDPAQVHQLVDIVFK